MRTSNIQKVRDNTEVEVMVEAQFYAADRQELTRTLSTFTFKTTLRPGQFAVKYIYF